MKGLNIQKDHHFKIKLIFLCSLSKKSFFNKSPKKSESNDTFHLIYILIVLVAMILVYNLSKLFFEEDASRYLISFIIPFFIIDFWSFKWRNRCSCCKKQDFKCDLKSHSKDISFYDSYSGYDTLKKKHETYISKDDINNSRYENVQKEIKSSTTHYYLWKCSSCENSEVLESHDLEVSHCLIVTTIIFIFSF
jgi:hypothetical protein